MRRTRDVALRASFYVAAALSGFAAAYVLKEWVPRLWDPRVLPDSSPDDKTSRPSPQQDGSSTATDPSTHARPSDDPVTDREACTPSASQAKALPPLRTHSLPPPPPSGHALLSGSFYSINADTITSPTTFADMSRGVEEEGASQTNTSDTESFVDVLSPAPTHTVLRRPSLRAHDLFAASHISFSELGSLVAPQNEANA